MEPHVVETAEENSGTHADDSVSLTEGETEDTATENGFSSIVFENSSIRSKSNLHTNESISDDGIIFENGDSTAGRKCPFKAKEVAFTERPNFIKNGCEIVGMYFK